MLTLIIATARATATRVLNYLASILTATFSSTTALGYGFHQATCIVGDKIFWICHYNGGPVNTCGYFNVKTGQWTSIAPLPEAHYGAAATYDPISNCIYVIGGLNAAKAYNQKVFKYNLLTGSWSTMMIGTAYNMRHCRGVLVGRRIYFLGQSATANHAYYDIDKNEFITFAGINIGETVASVVVDGYVYLFGGRTAQLTHLSAIYRFDPQSHTFEKVADLPVPTVYLNNIFKYGDYVVLVGGYASSNASNADSSYVYFNVKTHAVEKVTGPVRPTYGAVGFHEESRQFYMLSGIVNSSGLSNSIKMTMGNLDTK